MHYAVCTQEEKIDTGEKCNCKKNSGEKGKKLTDATQKSRQEVSQTKPRHPVFSRPNRFLNILFK